MSDEVTTVRMRREEPAHEGGPSWADVHHDEVANMEGAGWERAAEEPARKLSLEGLKRPQLVVEAKKYDVTILPGMSNGAAVAAIKEAMVTRASDFLKSQEQPQ